MSRQTVTTTCTWKAKIRISKQCYKLLITNWHQYWRPLSDWHKKAAILSRVSHLQDVCWGFNWHPLKNVNLKDRQFAFTKWMNDQENDTWMAWPHENSLVYCWCYCWSDKCHFIYSFKTKASQCWVSFGTSFCGQAFMAKALQETQQTSHKIISHTSTWGSRNWLAIWFNWEEATS